ncbi:MAG: hypothetical protein ACRDJN_11760 [Chloroflexota bacterium]
MPAMHPFPAPLPAPSDPVASRVTRRRMEIATRIVGQQTARKSFQEKWVKLIKEGTPSLADKNLAAFADGITRNYARPTELWRQHVESNKIYSEAYNTAVRDGDVEVAGAMKEAAQRVNELNRG